MKRLMTLPILALVAAACAGPPITPPAPVVEATLPPAVVPTPTVLPPEESGSRGGEAYRDEIANLRGGSP